MTPRQPHPATGGLERGSSVPGSNPSERAPSAPEARDDAGFAVQAPSVTRPTGGGALRGIGETFKANPVTGTASATVPIATSPGRAGVTPELALTYDSGAGNGPFGLGWQLGLGRISRRTEKGLPTYRDTAGAGADSDADAGDTFVLAGAEDLVPIRVEGPAGWTAALQEPRVVDGRSYRVERFRPRVDQARARIERWTNLADPGDSFWRTIDPDNTTSWYGRDADSRIADPADPARIFSWLISFRHDDRGNAIAFVYKPDDSAGVDTGRLHERNRSAAARTANRYIKRIRYGNRVPYFPEMRPDAPVTPLPDSWLFEVVFDYGDHPGDAPGPGETAPWPARADAFSTYRPGFEVRTQRLCRRVLMFHHFPEEADVGADCLVRSTDFTYAEPADADGPAYTVLTAAAHTAYRRDPAAGGYLSRATPPVEFAYSRPVLGTAPRRLDPESTRNLPEGVDGADFEWVDLDGEGLTGVLHRYSGGWLYKSNLSPDTRRVVDGQPDIRARLGQARAVGPLPAGPAATGRFTDLDGDGALDLVAFDGPAPGFFERAAGADAPANDTPGGSPGWRRFRSFADVPNARLDDPNVRFVDLTGDGRADILVTEETVFSWSRGLGARGFGPAARVAQPGAEAEAPRVVFADGTHSLLLADMSGDGLSDLVRVRDREVSYWPNLGYGRFGAKVTMDNPAAFDTAAGFDPSRVRFVDIDGSGPADIVYLGADGARAWINRSGNAWSAPVTLPGVPTRDARVRVAALDLLGNGTGCLVWSDPAAADGAATVGYLELMAAGKPHLLTQVRNNLGAETHIRYAPSTYFYLRDRAAGQPWLTRLPFPVQVVERVEVRDRIAGNRFVTRYSYHHGYYDGVEREFRGFALVEQTDTETRAALAADGAADDPDPGAPDVPTHVPPVLTRTWTHTGALYPGAEPGRGFAAGLDGRGDAYYRPPGQSDADAAAARLPDSVLPEGLTAADTRSAARALKGRTLRREVYALDDTPRAAHPYTVEQHSFRVQRLQPADGARPGAFAVAPLESLNTHYEREPDAPRAVHSLTLETDAFGNVLQRAEVRYGRRTPDPTLAPEDQAAQARTWVTFTHASVTNPVDLADAYRAPMPASERTDELTGYQPTGPDGRFRPEDLADLSGARPQLRFDEEIPFEAAAGIGRQRRAVRAERTLYRPDDLGEAAGDPAALLPLGVLESMAIAGEAYRLALTPGLIARVFRRARDGAPAEALLPDPAAVLGARTGDGGGYRDLDGDGRWWRPSGRVFFTDDPTDGPAAERGMARARFYRTRRSQDAFGQVSRARFDAYDLLTIESSDALGNRVSAGTRDAAGNLAEPAMDYRVLAPRLVTDANGNRTARAYDVFGRVVATAAMGKPGEDLGDALTGVVPDPDAATVQAHAADPLAGGAALLGAATTRMLHDIWAYHRTRDRDRPAPPAVYTLQRETHGHALAPGMLTRIQHGIAFSDGFGREIQAKTQAEPGPVPVRAGDGSLQLGPDGRPVMTEAAAGVRWRATGWTVFDLKGAPVREFEPFFTDRHGFEADVRIGVSSLLVRDPLGRAVARLHPNRTWDKVVFDAWRTETWDVNDTVLVVDPRQDDTLAGYLARLPADAVQPTWHALRTDPAHAAAFQARYPDAADRDAETDAARKTAIHAATPSIEHADAFGRTVATETPNRAKYTDGDPADPPVETVQRTRVRHDVAGNRRSAFDALGRLALRVAYDMLGRPLSQASLDGGQRWTLPDAAGQTLYTWDSRGQRIRATFDALRRPVDTLLDAGDGVERVIARTVYGESRPAPETGNLRGRPVELRDQAGVVVNDRYDFKGNLLETRRHLARDYQTTLDWAGAVALEPESYVSRSRYDARNRVTQTLAPNAGGAISVQQPRYNAAGLLQALDVWLDVADVPDGLLDPATADLGAVTAVAYAANGQRQRVDRGASDGTVVRTVYGYDPETFRLARVYTRRGVDPAAGTADAFPADAENPDPPPDTVAAPAEPAAGQRAGVQHVRYTRDPKGNVTDIRDDAQPTLYVSNQRIDAHARFTFDALYRLIEATGREHLGQNAGAPLPHGRDDAARLRHPMPGDGRAMGRYLERYRYDLAGNLEAMEHRGLNPAHPGWTRRYSYAEASALIGGNVSNRLSTTAIGANTATYSAGGDGYDAHGNMLRMPHLPEIRWDHRDRLRMTRRQAVGPDDVDGAARDGERTWYVYDASGQRVRKVTERADGRIKDERRYLGGFEVYLGAAGLRRETLHVMDDGRRIALVETRTAGDEPGVPARLVRYQLTNHLGSAAVELDAAGRLITYEEYSPFGSTTYQAVRSQTETPKRYRFSGRERDEESGFSYHGARYYAPWLGRWTSADPKGAVDGPNLYRYSRNNPVRLIDRTGTDPNDPDDDLSFDIGPLRLSNPRLVPSGSGQINLSLNNIWSENRSATINHASLNGLLGFAAQAELPAFGLEGRAIGVMELDATLNEGEFAAELTAEAGFDLGHLQLDIDIGAEGTTRIPSEIPIREGMLDELQASVLDNLQGTATADANLQLLGRTIGNAEVRAEIGAGGEGSLTAEGDLQLPIPFTDASLTLGRIDGAGSFTPISYNLSGDFHVWTPVGGGFGDYELSSAAGFSASAHYFGVLAGPLALTPDMQEMAAEFAEAGDVGPGGSVRVLDPGVAFGYAHLLTDLETTTIFSVGVAPWASYIDYEPGRPPLPAGGLLEPLLYGEEMSQPAGWYLGAGIRVVH